MGKTKADNGNIWQIILVIVFCAAGYLMPATGAITSYGWLVIGVFVALLICFMTKLPIYASIIVMMFYGLAAGTTFSTLIPDWLGNSTLWIMIAALMYGIGLQASGVSEFITSKLMGLKIVRKGPYYLMTIMIVVAFLAVGVTMAYPAVVMILYDIIDDVNKKLGLKQYNSWAVFTALGVGMATCFAAMAFPFSMYLNTYLAMCTSVGCTNVPNIMVLCVIVWITFIICTALLIAICKFILRPDVKAEDLEKLEIKTGEVSPEMMTSIKGTALSMVVIIVMMSVQVLCPSGWIITQFCTNMGTCGIFFIGCIILCLVPHPKKPGEKLYDFKTKGSLSISLKNLFGMGALLCVGGYMSSTDVGLTDLLNQICSPLIARLGPVMFIAALVVITCIITNLTLNYLPIYTLGTFAFSAFASQPEYQALSAAAILLATTMAVCLPSSSGQSLIFHGRQDLIKTSHFLGWGFPLCIICSFVMMFMLLLMKNALIG